MSKRHCLGVRDSTPRPPNPVPPSAQCWPAAMRTPPKRPCLALSPPTRATARPANAFPYKTTPPPRAAGYLDSILHHKRMELLPEWLCAAANAGLRVPEAYLPALLDVGRKNELLLRAAILPTLGKRGVWLAQHNPAWEYVRGQDTTNAETVWQTGRREARLTLLQRLRREDPARARTLLQSTWKEAALKERTALLPLLADGLSMEDEPFLESVLDDRSKEVRAIAAGLLSRLPQSRLVQRMIERLEPLLSVQKGGMLKKGAIVVELPQECDNAMQRDGIDPKPPRYSQKNAWWLCQMIGYVLLSHWGQQWELSPADVLKYARKSEWHSTLLDGWARAAINQRDAEWVEALLLDKSGTREDDELIRGLPQERAEAFMLTRLQSGKKFANTWHLLQQMPIPWGHAFSTGMLEYIRKQVRDTNEKKLDGTLRSVLPNIAHALSVQVIPDAVDYRWEEHAGVWPFWQNYINSFVELLQFRAGMLAALQERDEG